MNNYKISIILPIFNQEKYLEAAVESVINQTMDFKDIELILVDDKSTDSTAKIIKKYSDKYPNIKPIFLDKNSGGAGIPKNIGIENATAPYILFFDPDDILLDDICEVLYQKIVSENSDIVTGNFISYVNGIPYYYMTYNDEKEVIFPDKDYSTYKNFSAVGSLYNRNFIIKNDIRFIDEKTNEDTYFVHKCFFNAQKISYLDNYYGLIYFERGKNSSVTKTFDKKIILSTINAFSRINQLIKDMDVTYESDKFLKNIYARFSKPWDCSKEEEFYIYEKILEYKKNNIQSEHLATQHKIIDKLLESNFNLLYHFHKIYSTFLNNEFITKNVVRKMENRTPLMINSKLYEKVAPLCEKYY